MIHCFIDYFSETLFHISFLVGSVRLRGALIFFCSAILLICLILVDSFVEINLCEIWVAFHVVVKIHELPITEVESAREEELFMRSVGQ